MSSEPSPKPPRVPPEDPPPKNVIQDGSPQSSPPKSPQNQDPPPLCLDHDPIAQDLQLESDDSIPDGGPQDGKASNEAPHIEDIPADLKIESETSEKLAVESIVDTMLMTIATEKFYYGSVALEDLKEILLQEGDFVLRTGDTSATAEKPPVEVVARGKKGLVFVAFKFITLGVTTRTVTLNGSMGKTSIIELLSDHVRLSVPIDMVETRIRRAINRPIWQLNKEDIIIEKEIGRGAFGFVHKGKLKEGKGTKPAAIKQTKVCEENKTKMDAMLLEARLMRQLKHPNVVGFYGMLNNGVEAMIVMELVNGGSLDHFLKENRGKITVLEKLSYCFDVSYGLHYLHSRCMIHRDLAVRNCLIDIQLRIVKISDFGMSKQGNSYHIQANERTPIRWQAPEVIKTAIYTRECDIWSLGMVFFEIFADAAPPFEGIDNKTIRMRIHEPKFRPNVPLTTPPLMQAILQSVWDADPKKRMQIKKITHQLYKHSNRKWQKKAAVKKSASKAASTACARKASSVCMENAQAGGKTPKKQGSKKPSGVRRNSSIVAKDAGKKKSDMRKKDSGRKREEGGKKKSGAKKRH